MFSSIKRFLVERGWYKIHKSVRHVVGSTFLTFTFAGVFTYCGIPFGITWPLAGLLTFGFGCVKEALEHNTFATAMYDIMLNTFGVLIGLLPWILA